MASWMSGICEIDTLRGTSTLLGKSVMQGCLYKVAMRMAFLSEWIKSFGRAKRQSGDSLSIQPTRRAIIVRLNAEECIIIDRTNRRRTGNQIRAMSLTCEDGTVHDITAWVRRFAGPNLDFYEYKWLDPPFIKTLIPPEYDLKNVKSVNIIYLNAAGEIEFSGSSNYDDYIWSCPQ